MTTAATHQLYIDGVWVAPQAGGSLPTSNPATEEVIGHIARGQAADVDRAVDAARRALNEGDWPALTPAQRAGLLYRLADLVEAHAEELADIETRDNGMPRAMARFASVGGTIQVLRYNAGWATKLTGETSQPSQPGEWLAYTAREPVGVAGLIVPWNVPLVMAASKVSAAVAAGCTVVLKPAELTSLSAIRFVELVHEAGFPPGVINLVTGTGTEAGQALVDHPGVDKISFTGSTAVGKSIIRASSGNLKRVTLELGGKSPSFIFEDADLAAAGAAAAQSIFLNSGQICAAASRLYVQASVFDAVVEAIVERAQAMRVGDGMAADTQMGPLISAGQLDRVAGFVREAVADGAEVLTGGSPLAGPGHFMPPTVLVGTTHDMTAVREEIFGPVLCVMPFADDAELDELARVGNDSNYGLSATIWTRDISRAHRLVRRLQAGTVRINTSTGMDNNMPYGGYKQSGWGRENGRAGVEAFTEIKSVFVGL